MTHALRPARLLRSACLLCLALLLPLDRTAAAQPVPAKGTPGALEVATWNVEWFGSTAEGPADEALQFANVRAVIERSGIDLWALQEISDPRTFAHLLDSLGAGYGGALATQSGTQRIGFLYRTDVVQPRGAARHILEEFSDAFAGRPPLQLAARVTLPDTAFEATFVVVHMKAFSDPASYNRRVEAAARLKNRLDFTLSGAAVFVMGDFNDELLRSTAGGTSPYARFVEDTRSYFFPTLALERQGLGTWCGNSASCATGSTIDHLLVSDEVVPLYEEGSAARYAELLSAVPGYVHTTSDHLPVYARFRVRPPTTAVERNVLPEPLVLDAPYPNPFSERTTLRFRLEEPARVEIEVYDVLGRRALPPRTSSLPAGDHAVTLEGASLPPGAYVICLRAGTRRENRLAVRRP